MSAMKRIQGVNNSKCYVASSGS